jgi:GNAT superfamily N-acetyltransferase
MASGTAYHNEFGAAFWFPPHVQPDTDALVAVFEEALAETERNKVYSLLEQMKVNHIPQPHWYLRLIGVVPGSRNKGAGSSLMQPALEACDSAGLPAYLEATSERSHPFYERHGFRLVAEVRVEGSPGLWAMLRDPR